MYSIYCTPYSLCVLCSIDQALLAVSDGLHSCCSGGAFLADSDRLHVRHVTPELEAYHLDRVRPDGGIDLDMEQPPIGWGSGGGKSQQCDAKTVQPASQIGSPHPSPEMGAFQEEEIFPPPRQGTEARRHGGAAAVVRKRRRGKRDRFGCADLIEADVIGLVRAVVVLRADDVGVDPRHEVGEQRPTRLVVEVAAVLSGVRDHRVHLEELHPGDRVGNERSLVPVRTRARHRISNRG